MKGALIVGIDHYKNAPLYSCVKDAKDVKVLLETNEDGSPNIECDLLVSSQKNRITASVLRKGIEELFTRRNDVSLFYFSGHGIENILGGYIVTQDAKEYDEGVSVVEILTMANNSPAKEKIIILDCCNSGNMGNAALFGNKNDTAIINMGVSILTSSSANEFSRSRPNNNSLFTDLLIKALSGGAADILGNVTIAGIYAYVEYLLGALDQRPLLKSNVRELTPVRKCDPAVDLKILRKIIQYFPQATSEHKLDPTYEPDCEKQTNGKFKPNAKKTEIFGHLQNYRSINLIIPVGEKHMYDAAMKSKSCRLTALGKYYWDLVSRKKI